MSLGYSASGCRGIDLFRLPEQPALHAARNHQRLPGDVPRQCIGGQIHHRVGNVLRPPNLGQRHGRGDFADCSCVAELRRAAWHHRPSGAHAIDPSTAIIPRVGREA